MGTEGGINIFGEEFAVSWTILGPICVVAQNGITMLPDFETLLISKITLKQLNLNVHLLEVLSLS